MSILIDLRGTCFLKKAEHMLLCKPLPGATITASWSVTGTVPLELFLDNQQCNTLCASATLQRCQRTCVAWGARAATPEEDNLEQQCQAQQLYPAHEGSGSSYFGTELKPQ